jgi:hypothetical protein
MNCRLVGTVDIATTGRHKLTLQSQSAFSAQAWFDVAEFRPVDMDQLISLLRVWLYENHHKS